MVRIFIFLAVVMVLGFGFAWFADRPGEVALRWQGMEYETSLMVVIAGIAALLAVVMSAYWVVSVILRSPSIMRRFFRNRRRDRGYSALSRGLISAGAGDVMKARSQARESRKLLGGEPLVELLEAQTLLLEGDRAAARAKFTRMLDDDDTQLIALRGLHFEAEREGAVEAARHYAEEASKRLPALPWAANALLRYQAREGDWDGALRTLEMVRSSGKMDKAEVARKRAVLLTAQAMAEEAAHPERAVKLTKEAHKLAPDLVPAAVTGATALVRNNDLRRAAKLLESVWKRAPHPEIAEAYVNLRSGDSVLDRLARARKLLALNNDGAEGNFALARAAITAKDWEAARKAMEPILSKNPTQRACMIMAELEEGQYGDRGRVRDWLSRAIRAPRDAVWIADGHSSPIWKPVSPLTGEIDAYRWMVPPEPVVDEHVLAGADLETLTKPLAALEVEAQTEPVPQATTEVPSDDDVPELEPVVPEADKAVSGEDEEAKLKVVDSMAETNAEEAGPNTADETGKTGDAHRPDESESLQETASDEEAATDAQNGKKDEETESEKVTGDADSTQRDNVVLLDRLPDDPGVDNSDDEDKRKKFRLF